jgi:rRNA processing protein Krr1/Pno1
MAQVPVPQHRMTPLKKAWLDIYQTVTGNLKLDMRMNLKTKKVWFLSSVSGLCRCKLADVFAQQC